MYLTSCIPQELSKLLQLFFFGDGCGVYVTEDTLQKFNHFFNFLGGSPYGAADNGAYENHMMMQKLPQRKLAH